MQCAFSFVLIWSRAACAEGPSQPVVGEVGRCVPARGTVTGLNLLSRTCPCPYQCGFAGSTGPHNAQQPAGLSETGDIGENLLLGASRTVSDGETQVLPCYVCAHFARHFSQDGRAVKSTQCGRPSTLMLWWQGLSSALDNYCFFVICSWYKAWCRATLIGKPQGAK